MQFTPGCCCEPKCGCEERPKTQSSESSPPLTFCVEIAGLTNYHQEWGNRLWNHEWANGAWTNIPFDGLNMYFDYEVLEGSFTEVILGWEVGNICTYSRSIQESPVTEDGSYNSHAGDLLVSIGYNEDNGPWISVAVSLSGDSYYTNGFASWKLYGRDVLDLAKNEKRFKCYEIDYNVPLLKHVMGTGLVGYPFDIGYEFPDSPTCRIYSEVSRNV